MTSRRPVERMKADPDAITLARTGRPPPSASVERGLLKCSLELIRTYRWRGGRCRSSREGTDVDEDTSVLTEHLAEISPRVLHCCSRDYLADV